MLKFWRKENIVYVCVEHGIFWGNEYFELEIHQGKDYQAELLREALNENLNRHITKIKEEYYNQGWKDAKAKTKKRTWFGGGWKN